MFFEYRYHITIQLGFIFPDKLKVSDNSIRKFDFENVPFDNSYTHGWVHFKKSRVGRSLVLDLN